MKTVKLMAAALLIFLGVVLCGELRSGEVILSLETSCDEFWYSIPDNRWNSAASDIEMLSAESNVTAFVYNTVYETLTENTIEIYVTSDGENAVKKKLGISSSEIKSLFNTDLSIKFNNIGQLNSQPTCPYVFVVGENSNTALFSDKMSEIYKLKFSQAATGKNNSESFILCIWVAILVFILMISFFESISAKKEVFIKATFGTSIFLQFFKKSLLDILIYILSFSTAIYISSFMNSAAEYLKIYIAAALILSLLNTVYFLPLFSSDVKSAAGKNASSKYLRFNYIMKMIFSATAVICLSSAFSSYAGLYDCHTAKPFFEKNKEHYFIDFQYKIMTDDPLDKVHELHLKTNYVNYKIYDEYFDICKPIILNRIRDIPYPMIYANSGAKEYLDNLIPEVDLDRMTNKIALLIPRHYENSGKEVVNISSEILRQYGFEGYDFDNIVSYSSDIPVVGIDGDLSKMYEILKSPIIIYNSKPYSDIYGELTESDYIYMPDNMMLALSNDIKEEIVDKYNLQSEICMTTNIFEHFSLTEGAFKF
ncbi:MAG: hypothetical protein ACI4JX_03535, partial [Oscillospiraceae bacterium]